jgi:hypothetical protein
LSPFVDHDKIHRLWMCKWFEKFSTW